MFSSGGHFYLSVEKPFFFDFFPLIEKVCKTLEIFKKCMIFLFETFFTPYFSDSETSMWLLPNKVAWQLAGERQATQSGAV